MCTSAGKTHGGDKVLSGISELQSIDKSSWSPRFKNKLVNADSGFLLFDFMFYLLVVVIKDSKHRICYYFL